MLVKIINTTETLAHINWPTERADVNVEFFLDFVQQIEGVFTITVHLVHKDDDGRLAHTADFHQLACLSFYPLRHVDNDDNAIHRRERAKSIFGEVLVSGRIEDIYFMVGIIKRHDGRRHGDTALLLDFHPVRRRRLLNLI